ncbi:MAG TPA: ABC transporter substrate-binding protein [Clostridiaceae bacterium]|nr:ABC transporter substrate-binding protein [Clostridiaceae bacterium]
MKKIKVILLALLTIALLFSMFACKKQQDSAAEKQPVQDEANVDADSPPELEQVEDDGEAVSDQSVAAEDDQEEPQDNTSEEGEDTEANPDPQEVEKINFALDWTPNTNHSGLFLAQQQGFYAAEGLEVDFQESDMNFIEMVATESATFGIASQEQVLQARASAAKIPVVSVAAILQHNTSGFASPVDREIKAPSDFAGKTYSGWGTELELAFIKTLMEKEGADYSQVKIINQSANNFIASMETEADFAWIYWGWDGVNCELQDYATNFILLQDIDPRLDFYSPTIITNETVIKDNPDLIKRFLRATAKGYELAIENPELAVEALLEVAPELDEELVRRSQTWLNDKYIDDADSWGLMKPEMWSDFKAWMLDNKTLENDLDPAEAFTNDFLP